MGGRLVDRVGSPQLHQFAEVHDSHAVADVAHDRQVVGDEEVGQPELLAQLDQQVEDLGLDRDVERADRLVTDDELRLDRQGAGDPDPLSLSAAEFVGVAVGVTRVEADQLQQLAHPIHARSTLGQAVRLERFTDDRTDRHARIQAAVRILEDDLHPAPHLAQLVALEAHEVLPPEADDPFGRVAQADHGPPGRALAAPRLADQAERLALLDFETDVVHGANAAGFGLEDARQDREMHLQALDLDQVLAGRQSHAHWIQPPDSVPQHRAK